MRYASRGRGDIAGGDRSAEPRRDGVHDGVERDRSGEGGEAAQQHGVGNGAPGVLERQLGGGNGQQPIVPVGCDEVRRGRARRSCETS